MQYRPEVEWLDDAFRGLCPRCCWHGPERIRIWDAEIDAARHEGAHRRSDADAEASGVAAG